MTQNRVFLVISTGQNVANLPPVLEYASPGDQVQWIESAEARRGNWSQGAKEIFEQFGLQLRPTINVESVNDPAELMHACATAIANWSPQHGELYLVANGGNKLAPLGLWLASRGLRPVILYGDDRHAVCHDFRLDDPPHAMRAPYRRHQIDLPEIFKATGHCIAGAAAERFWPGALPDEIVNEAYGVDPNETRRLHEAFYCGELPDLAACGDDIPYERLTELLPAERLQKWQNALKPLLVSVKARSEGLYKSVYHATVNLARAAREAAARQPPHRRRRLGPAFERAIVRRVHAYLETRRPACVRSAWRSVSVVNKSDPARTLAEFDVLLVLTNGILLNLECKTATDVPQKDLDARLLNLQATGSRLAQMALCIPLYTQFIGKPWANRYHEMRQRMQKIGSFPLILLTIPGQPRHYQCTDEQGTEQQFACPSIEDGLERLLAPYEAPMDGVLHSDP